MPTSDPPPARPASTSAEATARRIVQLEARVRIFTVLHTTPSTKYKDKNHRRPRCATRSPSSTSWTPTHDHRTAPQDHHARARGHLVVERGRHPRRRPVRRRGLRRSAAQTHRTGLRRIRTWRCDARRKWLRVWRRLCAHEDRDCVFRAPPGLRRRLRDRRERPQRDHERPRSAGDVITLPTDAVRWGSSPAITGRRWSSYAPPSASTGCCGADCNHQTRMRLVDKPPNADCQSQKSRQPNWRCPNRPQFGDYCNECRARSTEQRNRTRDRRIAANVCIACVSPLDKNGSSTPLRWML